MKTHHRHSKTTAWVMVGLFLIGMLQFAVLPLVACPFCSAVSQTFAEEIDSLDAAVFVRLISKAEPETDDDGYDSLPKSTFEVVKILKGDEHVKIGTKIETHYFGRDHDGTFIVMGTDSPDIIWTSPLALSERGVEYVEKVVELPKDATRLQFFQDFLEDEDEMLARDAYDEFAKAPYSDIIDLKPHMNHKRVLHWIEDTENVPASRRRLYLTMLGVCGGEEDAKLLETYMQSEVKEDKLGLDAMVACYLTLKGPDGMDLIKELYLANKESEYADTYSAIMALRFHGAETEVIPKERVLEGFRCLLDRPDLADLVIPDLARWEDWSVMPKLFELYSDANAESNWIRVPIVNYVRACPLESADEMMEKLREVDPDAVKRASTFFPLGPKKKASSDANDNAESDDSAIAIGNLGSRATGSIDSDAAAMPKAPSPPPELGLETDAGMAVATVSRSMRQGQSGSGGGKDSQKWPMFVVCGLVVFGAVARLMLSKQPA